MKSQQLLLIAFLLAVANIGIFTSQANELLEKFETELICHNHQRFLAPADSADHRKYAPNRDVDFLHLKLDITPSFEEKTVKGTTTLQFKPISRPVTLLHLDAVELTIDNVTSSEPIEEWHLSTEQLIIRFENPIAVDQEAFVQISHQAQPEKGMYFRTPDMGYLEGEAHLFTQGEPIESRHWFPCFDSPNEKLTTEVICHVPDGMLVLSNGHKLSEKKNETTGLVTFHWLQDKPHVNYLIAIVAGYFESVSDRYRDIPMAFYTLPSQIALAQNSFEGTKDMMAFLESETGVPYPWDRYDQACVNDFVAGGMENTTLTILTDSTLFDDSTENLRSSQNLVAHELAHQWFGDLVTCKDWSHLWLNEGFASYFEVLYHEHIGGKDAFHYSLLQKLGGWLNNPNDPVGIVSREYDNPMQQFGYRAYPKAAWVLHMIRSTIGPDLFRQMMKTYLERHTYESVVTEDLNNVLEELTGRSFDQFFNQWVYHGGHPDLKVTYQWDTKTQMAKLNIRQSQKPNDHVLLFRFPLTVRFKADGWSKDFEVEIKSTAEDFYFPLPEKPSIARIDPEFTTLLKTEFKIPTDMLLAQASDPTDLIGRILAIRQLGKKDSKKSIEALKDRLHHDSFYGARIEASKALRSLHSPEALKALLTESGQTDPRVEHQVNSDIGTFFSPDALSQALKIIETETNPIIRSSAITSLSAYDSVQLKAIIVESLKSSSPQERIASAAVRVINDLADPTYVTPLLEFLMSRQTRIPTRVFSSGLTALARAGHDLTDRTLIREFLIGKTSHPKNRIRSTAIRALGTLGDKKAIPVLNRLAAGHDNHPDRNAAQSALSTLRKEEAPEKQLKHFHESIDALKKSESELKSKLETLQKQFEALTELQEDTKEIIAEPLEEVIPPTH